jgi:hypothetical protein
VEPRAPKAGEATFVVGNPGSTQRLFTMDQIAFQREVSLPITNTVLSELRGRLITAMEQSPSASARAATACSALKTRSRSISAGRRR